MLKTNPYSKYMKDIITNKRKIPEAEISTMLANYTFKGGIPKKLGDPGVCIFALYIPPIGYWLAALPSTLPLQTSVLCFHKVAGKPGFSVLLNFSGKL